MSRRKNYYAVVAGKNPGIYTNWEECRRQVDGHPGAVYMGFYTESEALSWLKKKETEDGCGNRPKEKKVVGLEKKTKQRRILPEELNAEQRSARDKMLGGENIFLTGEAGTGKSFLLRCFIERVKQKNVVICAPTGIAAIQIGGTTIHRAFGRKPGPVSPEIKIKKTNDVIDAADIIIIDEISMCRFDLFEYVCRYIQKSQEISKRKKQLIVCGDLWDEMHFSNLMLKQVMRQKNAPDFLENLNRIRHGDICAAGWFNEHAASGMQDGIFLYGKNDEVRRKNKEEIEKLHADIKKYCGENHDFGQELPTDEVLGLCVGAKVMSVINDGENKFQNGSLGVVKELKRKSVVVEFENGNVEELKIAFAVTIHKSQGQTYESANINPSCFAHGQLYVALSRVTDIRKLHLLNKIKSSDVRVSKEVNEFSNKISKVRSGVRG